MKKVLSCLILVIIIIALLGVSGLLVYNAVIAKTEEVKNPVLSLDVENYGTVKIELYPEYAPNTVKNIIALANNGYYNGKIFYGMDDVAIYVGRNSEGESDNPTISDIDKSVSNKTEENTDENNVEIENTKLDNDYEYSIDGEFVANGFKQNTLKHKKGIVSMVRADYTQQLSTLTEQSYNSATSQFTIIMDDEAGRNLNGMYTAFGKVIEGLDIVEKIYGLEIKTEETDEESSSESSNSIQAFANAPVITNAVVDTNGVEYDLPDTHEAFDYSAYLQQLMTQYYTNNQ